jgi:hypothetical protein
MTPQEAFEKAAKHLIAQGEPAGQMVNGSWRCYYRSPDGLKCAIGALIPDELYSADMECNSAYEIVHVFEDLAFLRDANIFDEDSVTNLLDELQVLHDSTENWSDIRQGLRQIGEHYGLDTSFLSPTEST